MIAQNLLEILVCPACKQPLEYREKPESLKCFQCHRVYPVKDDIPIAIDQARVPEMTHRVFFWDDCVNERSPWNVLCPTRVLRNFQ
jgi:LSD1 subclass zinc finger protein